MMPQMVNYDRSSVEGQSTSAINIPDTMFDTPAMQGTMQQVLSKNLGRYVVVDFLVGVDAIQRRAGILESVGRSFLVLYEHITRSHQVCDIFSVKFVAFFPQGYRPAWETDPNLNLSGVLRPGGTSYGLGSIFPQGGQNMEMQSGMRSMPNANWRTGNNQADGMYNAMDNGMMDWSDGINIPADSAETMNCCTQHQNY